MAGFQAKSNIYLRVRYSHYNLLEGQPVTISEGDGELYQYIKQHPNFVEVQDDTLIRLAPPLHLVRKPEDPHTMRKEDILKELVSYGIQADPYDFSNKLSMQLKIARKMLKRNFITVLDPRGRPIFIDRLKLPAPVVSGVDKTLEEPPEPNMKDFEDMDQVSHVDYSLDNEVKVREVERDDSVMQMTAVYDENVINKGKSFEQFLEDVAMQDFKSPVEIEKVSTPIILEVQEEKEEIKAYVVEEKEYYKYLLETKDRYFMVEKIHEEELKKYEDIKWSKINIDVIDTILRNRDKFVKYEKKMTKIRWELIAIVQKIYEESDEYEKKKLAMEIFMLQKRHDELCNIEPSWRDFKAITLKRRITELNRYGMNTQYDEKTNIKKYGQQAYTLAKLGLQIPETDEEIEKKLADYNRAS